MKNFKKTIILSIIMGIIIIILIFNLKDNTEEVIVDNIFVETEEPIKETNKIILHITGEVNTPRNYRIRRRSKACRCNRQGRRVNRRSRYKQNKFSIYCKRWAKN